MIFKLTRRNTNQLADIVAQAVMNGGIVVLPFDTVYGFACDPSSDITLGKVFDIKNRPFNKTIGLATNSLKNIKKLSYLNNDKQKFITQRVPGPYSFILRFEPVSDIVISKFCQHEKSVLVRIPDSKLVEKVVRNELPFVAQTSANLHGKSECYSVDELLSQYGEKLLKDIELVIDGGKIDSSGSSAIVDLTKEIPAEIERERKN